MRKMPADVTPESCPDHWHCDPQLAAHLCDKPDRTRPCPTCGEPSVLQLGEQPGCACLAWIKPRWTDTVKPVPTLVEHTEFRSFRSRKGDK